MATTTACTNRLDAAVGYQIQYLPYMQLLFKDGGWLGFPCGNELFETIIKVNIARYEIATSDINPRRRLRMITRILSALASFDTSVWAEEFAKKADLQDAGQGKALSETYRLAVLLYCWQTLIKDGGILPKILGTYREDLRLPSSREEALCELLSRLERIWRDEKSWSARATLWPLLVAGLELPEPTQRDFICRCLRRLVQHLGAMMPINAASLLENYWNTPGLWPHTNLGSGVFY